MTKIRASNENNKPFRSGINEFFRIAKKTIIRAHLLSYISWKISETLISAHLNHFAFLKLICINGFTLRAYELFIFNY
jgi:hypothetical protein